MVISIGEILVDLFGRKEGEGVSYSQRAGGAPFNVACSAKKAGYESGFVGKVGCDTFGVFLCDYAKKSALDYLDIARDENSNTTLAIVSLDDMGERSFCFYRKNTADYKITFDQIESAVLRAKIVHLGTLMLGKEEGKAVADSVVELAKKHNKILSVDVNYRDDIFDGHDAVSIYRKYIEMADIVKFSEEELDMFATGKTLEEKMASLSKNKLVCVTLGKNGSCYSLDGKFGKVGTISVTPVDTTGAGDAFFGCLLGQLSGKDLFSLTEDELNGIFFRANVCGALTTTDFGAIDPIPTKSVLDDICSKQKV